MVKCLPELSIFTVFLKNKNIIFKIRRSKVTDYAALKTIINLQKRSVQSCHRRQKGSYTGELHFLLLQP